ncbi:MAG: TIGR02147 family protein [Fibrobacteria bacterium]|nr:TIGR02147 family protein [Fibrobacteria bacterium]
MHLPKPDIFDYLDFRDYLKDVLDYIRGTQPDFSFQLLVSKYGLKSRSHYIDILKGRTLTKKFVPCYLNICGLSGKGAEYFNKLVVYSQTSNRATQTALFDEIVELSSNLETIKLEKDAYQYFARWTHPVLLSIIDLDRKEKDPAKLASKFKKKVSVWEVKRSLHTLIEMGFISWDNGKGEWCYHNRFLKCTDKTKSLALGHFHEKMLSQGLEAYTKDFENQEFSTLTLSMSKSTRDGISTMIAEMRKQILAMVKKDRNPQLVLQLNMQTFEHSLIEGNND